MKLIIDASTFHSGGGIEYLKNLIFYLSVNRKNKITLICPHILKSDFKKLNIKIIFVKRGFLNLILFYFNNKKLLKCDYYLSLNGINLPKDTLSIIFFHNLLIFDDIELSRHNYSIFNIKAKILRTIIKLNYNKSKIAVFFSDSSRKIIGKYIRLNNKKDRIIYHGINKKFFLPVKNISTSKTKIIRLVYPSSLLFYKNHLILIDSLQKFSYKDYKIELNFIGQKFDYIADQIQNFKGINKNISLNYLGDYNLNQQINLFKKMDAILYCSSCETFGLSLYEGALSGLPIICSNKITCQELLGNNVFYFDPFKDHSLNKAIINFINNPVKANDYSIKNQNIIKKLSWENQIIKTIEIMKILQNEKKNTTNIK